ncbi:MAG: hypothetical protein IPJ30_16165 [Acidobacteria bacterium]|nr:hypothetical protein [Acidobacteriota bacterium]
MDDFTQEDAKYSDQFLGWLQPVTPGVFQRQIVLEGGCGKGRHRRWRQNGAQPKLSASIFRQRWKPFSGDTAPAERAHRSGRHFQTAVQKEFDYAFLVGVLHHTPDPKGAFVRSLPRFDRAGRVSAWIYGEENNEWIINYVNPIREGFTSKIRRPMLYRISKLDSRSFSRFEACLQPANAVAGSLMKKALLQRLPESSFDLGWREQHNIVFDHLNAC